MDVVFGLTGRKVESVEVGGELRVMFDSRERCYVDVCNFSFIDATGTQWEVRVGDDPVTAGPVLGLLGTLRDRVTGAHVEGWELTVLFDSGARIVCPPDPDYEAWAVAIPGEMLRFCSPGAGPDRAH